MIVCFEVFGVTPLKPMALCATAGDGGGATASTRTTSMIRLDTSCEAGSAPYVQMCVASHFLCARDLLPARRSLFGMSMLWAQREITCNLAGRG